MSGTLSGGISIQGLGSGINFGDMIDQLKSIESLPKARLEVWRAEWMTRVDAFKEIQTCMQEAKTALKAYSSLSKMLLRTVDSSKDTVATAKADANIDEGVYTIDVQQLATASVFSNKKTFDSKQAKLTTDGDKTFAYTYKGVRREITVANNSTLENFVNQINKDSGNPGVRASLIKSGSGYIFQIQGKDTGSSSTLNIESNLDGFDSTPLFSGRDVVINNSGGDQSYTYEYGGKKRSLTIADGMTAAEFIDQFNAQNSGVTASLELKGSNYVIRMRDTKSKSVVNLPASTDCEALGGGGFTASGFDPATTPINTTGDPQTFSYNYLGKTYRVNIGTDFTMNDLVDKINAEAPDGVTAAFNATTGKIAFTATDKVLTTTDATFKFREYPFTETINTPEIEVPAGTTLKEFVQLFNKNKYSTKHGYTAFLESDGAGGQTLAIKGKDGQKLNLYAAGDSSLDGDDTAKGILLDTSIAGLQPAPGGQQQSDPFTLGPLSVDLCTSSTLPGLGGRSELDGREVVINTSGANAAFSFTAPDGTSQTLNVAAGTTLQGFVDAFNAQFNTASSPDNLGIEARAVAMGSGYEIHYFKKNAGGEEEEIRLDNVNDGGMDRLRDSGDNWYSKQATDAKFTMNGWPQVMTSETNSLTEVVEGLDITLKSTGETSLTVLNDKEALKENIQAVVDAINSLRSKIKELTKVDTDKEVKNPEVNEKTGLLELQSQFTWQMGSTLTGNYGVQLMTTRLKNLTAESADGFVGRSNKNDLLNDLFTNWAQIGIGTVTDESDPEAGLLRIDEEALDKAIDEDIRNVAELFSADSQASTNSSDFSVADVGTRAKPGVYDVTYTVENVTDEDGNPVIDPVTGKVQTRMGDVYINGVKATTDSAFPGRYTVGDYNNEASGLAIQFTEADLVAGNHTSQVRIKQGKVGEMVDFLTAELQPVIDEHTENAGTIPRLIYEYSDPRYGIIAGIDKKIERETTRLALWEQRQRAQFNRLDTLLTKMNQTMEKNASALGSLNSNSSK